MANESVTVTQTLDQVTVVSEGPVGLNAGGTISGALNVGVDGTGHDVKFFGDTAGKYMQWDQSADKLFINGELEVNGSATTFNSTVITIDDPIFSLGGQQRTDALDDSKDRGLEFFYHDGAQKTGFMGYDDSADAFTFLTSATNSNEVFSGTAGNLLTGNITADSADASGQFTAKRSGSARLKTMLADNDGGFQYTGSGGNIFYAGASGNDFLIRDGDRSTNGDLRFIVSQSGNVGIGGTSSPSNQLTVTTSSINDGVFLETSQPVTYARLFNSNSESFPVGNLNLGYGSNFSAVIQALSNRMSLKGGHTTGGQISFSSSSSEVMRMTSSGLGIGTTSPSGKLTSYVSATRQINLHSGSIGADFSVICDNSGNPAVQIKGTGTADLFSVLDNTTEVFKIADGGNVSVDGNISLDGTHKVSFGQGHSIAASGSKLNIIGFDNSAGINLITQGSAGGKAVNFQTGTHSSNFATVASIDDSGNLSLDGQITAAGDVAVDTDTFFVDVSTDRVGINQAVPTAPLHIGGGVSDTYAKIGYYWTFASNTLSSSGALKLNAGSGENIHLQENGTDRLVVKHTTGNVGINQTAPLAKLDISGNTDTFAGMAKIYLTDTSTNSLSRNWSIGNGGSAYGNFTIAVSSSKGGNAGDASAVNALVIKPDGKVGLGTSNPSYDLTVAGHIGLTTGTTNSIFLNNGNVSVQGDSNNKLHLNGLDEIRLSTASTERLRLESGGTVRVFGNLQVDGTTTTVNSTTVTVDDPVLTLGGDTAPSSDDNKDRGIEFRYYDGSAKVGFMGWDDSAGGFTFLKAATNSSEVFSGTAASLTTGAISAGGHINLNDNHLQNVGVLQGTASGGLLLKHGDGNFAIVGSTNGKVDLRHAGSVKLETSSTGIEVTGGFVTSGDVAVGGHLNVNTGSIDMRGNDLLGLSNLKIEMDGASGFKLTNPNNGHGVDIHADDLTFHGGGIGTRKILTDAGDLEISPVGNVGIGVAAPATKVHILNGTANDPHIRLSDPNSSSTNDATGYLEVYHGNTTGRAGYFGMITNAEMAMATTTSSGKLCLYTGTGVKALTIDNSQNVGIGTTAPTARLDLTTSLSSGATLNLFKSALTSYPSNTFAKGAYIELTDDTNAGGCAVFGIDVDITHTKNHASNRIYGVHSVLDGTGSNNQYAGYFESAAAINYSGDHGQSATLLVNGKGTGHLFRVEDSDTAVFTIVDGGNVGIGTTAPAKTLDVDGDVRVLDSHKFFCGDSDDLELHHDATDSFLTNKVGDLTISNEANDKDIIFQSDNGSGGLDPYITIDGGNTRTNIHKDFQFTDNVKSKFGTSGDLEIFHDGTNSYIENKSAGGDLYIKNTDADEDVIFQVSNAASGTENYIILDASARTSVVHKTLRALDNINIQAGTDGDLRIFHNGTDGTIANVDGGGDLLIENYVNDKDIIFKSDDGSGGVATYLTIDGGREEVVASKPLIQTPGTVDPANNGELAFTVISNTSIKLKYKGDDGTVRSTTLTLS